jgi:hypothetical protein
MRVVGEEWRFYPIRAMRGGMLISISDAAKEFGIPNPVICRKYARSGMPRRMAHILRMVGPSS